MPDSRGSRGMQTVETVVIVVATRAHFRDNYSLAVTRSFGSQFLTQETRAETIGSGQLQNILELSSRSENRWRADGHATAHADQHLRFGATSGEPAHDLAAGV